ncbi:MAG TPA: LPS assembly lipoprotein LptE [Saprospiraceae bacterium]|jgi:hypothetical protein|nr:MAG: hypothetical protein UZ08_BCD001002905 [Candidatus Parvibacillus calidus]MBX2935942.1 hypothetical protein [Saprospiraceae bacterium]MBX7179245.1 hypothetical protein [Saprospiraceae bacterium]MCB0591266.1 hypothetical protein [Saprospiraceae bacterium]MCC7148274.1 hypothetical protein [Saprospiraceae bacterium]
MERSGSSKYLSMILVISLLVSGCYSFRGTSIPSNTNTFYVGNFTLDTYDAPFNLSQMVTEKLKDKIRKETRLKYVEIEPDIEFVGKVTNYVVSPVAPQANQIPSANRLEITINVSFLDQKNEKNKWTSNFTFFKDFSKDANLIDVRDGLANDIFDQLVEDVYNRAFTNW